MAIPLIVAGGLSGAGALASFSSGRKSAREVKRSRKAAQQIAEGGLQFAREVFSHFKPVIEQLGNFFADTDINDVISGKVVSPQTQTEITAANTSFREQDRDIAENLASRGLGDQDSGQLIAANLRTPRAQIKSDIIGAGVERDLNQRQAFANLGVNVSRSVSEETQNLAQSLLGNARRSSASATNAGITGGQALSNLIKVLGGVGEGTPPPVTDPVPANPPLSRVLV